MSNLGVGKEVLSHCNKCKLTLSHIIVVMKDANIPGKVQCNTCKSTHAFKDPTAKKVKKVISRKKTGKRKPAQPLSEIWQEAMNKSTASSQTYSIKAQFSVGDVISHPKFGDGIVEKVLDKTKIEVMFRDDVKTLVHNIG